MHRWMGLYGGIVLLYEGVLGNESCPPTEGDKGSVKKWVWKTIFFLQQVFRVEILWGFKLHCVCTQGVAFLSLGPFGNEGGRILNVMWVSRSLASDWVGGDVKFCPTPSLLGYVMIRFVVKCHVTRTNCFYLSASRGGEEVRQRHFLVFLSKVSPSFLLG